MATTEYEVEIVGGKVDYAYAHRVSKYSGDVGLPGHSAGLYIVARRPNGKYIELVIPDESILAYVEAYFYAPTMSA